MRYMLVMNVPSGTGDYQITSWTPDEVKAHMAFMHRYNKELQEAGERVDAQGLAPPSQARLVRAGKNAEPITDGPFPESKEFLAGFWLIDVDSVERAYALAAKASVAPGPGGAPLNMAIEVRFVLSELPTVAGQGCAGESGRMAVSRRAPAHHRSPAERNGASAA